MTYFLALYYQNWISKNIIPGDWSSKSCLWLIMGRNLFPLGKRSCPFCAYELSCVNRRNEKEIKRKRNIRNATPRNAASVKSIPSKDFTFCLIHLIPGTRITEIPNIVNRQTISNSRLLEWFFYTCAHLMSLAWYIRCSVWLLPNFRGFLVGILCMLWYFIDWWLQFLWVLHDILIVI